MGGDRFRGRNQDQDVHLKPTNMETEMNAPTPKTEAINTSPGNQELQAEANEEQLLYARILAAGMYIGLGILLVTFALYLTGVMAPAVPIKKLPHYWILSAHEYLETINHHHLHLEEVVVGWGWLRLLHKADFLNFVGIAVLALVTVVCYLGILPTLFRKKDWIYGTIAILEVVILTLAASGLVSVGH